ncbi:YigZ family protein [Halalkalibacillus halophilus]|uniref:YigZ family protein n=1 Tax=Halalkalibacillus halophilus TaxID=392827 RepID=UPI000412F2BD|nr:YigZ family protein [Halalkalibacillus halophilus]
MLEHYLTVKEEGFHEIHIQKSRFIGYVKRTETEEEAQAFIQRIKKEHNQANHNCSAYMIGEQNLIQKANDDGEPSGTAGVPMLEVLKQMDLKDTTVVVTRYFGGIKLGKGGLIRAYSTSVSEALRQIGIVECSLMQEIHIHVTYDLIGKLENELRGNEHLIDDIIYAENVTFHVLVPFSNTEAFQSWVMDLTSGKAGIECKDNKYVEKERADI